MPTDHKTKERILDFVVKHPWARTSQIAKKLKLDGFDVSVALTEMEHEGKVRSEDAE
jgi:predicted ArsR family transcriptional regulator